MNCRHCDFPLEHVFLDLGSAPATNAYLTESDLCKEEKIFPLKLFVCAQCWLVQTEDFVRPEELFSSNYAYFSSTSQSWLDHASYYVDQMCSRFKLDTRSHVIEIASNDGYLLKNFVALKIPCLGIEPTSKTADAAENLGVPVLREFFDSKLATLLLNKNKQADLVLANNVYAHVPDINDFTIGLKKILKPNGVVTLEFPHLLRLLEENQFDTIYHEHFSYLSLHTVSLIFEKAGLKIWDVDKLLTHGGSLRVYGCHSGDNKKISTLVNKVLADEQKKGLMQISTYQGFQARTDQVKKDLLRYLNELNFSGKRVAAYGAAAKGNTLLNYAGIDSSLLPYVCDAAPSKQGKYMPGSHIPILPPSKLREDKPDIILILPWNLTAEVISQNAYVHEWGGKFVTVMPQIRVIS
jgi:SAM-dependent methyltransferase